MVIVGGALHVAGDAVAFPLLRVVDGCFSRPTPRCCRCRLGWLQLLEIVKRRLRNCDSLIAHTAQLRLNFLNRCAASTWRERSTRLQMMRPSALRHEDSTRDGHRGLAFSRSGGRKEGGGGGSTLHLSSSDRLRVDVWFMASRPRGRVDALGFPHGEPNAVFHTIGRASSRGRSRSAWLRAAFRKGAARRPSGSDLPSVAPSHPPGCFCNKVGLTAAWMR